ncbi:MAG: hypothetical protein V3S30_11115 [Thermoanaerobaculia bacterium]
MPLEIIRGAKSKGRVKLVLWNDGKVYTALGRRRRRPDVARRHGSLNYLRSGFEFERSLLDLPSGTYRVGIIQKSQSGLVMCTRGLQLVVGEQSMFPVR